MPQYSSRKQAVSGWYLVYRDEEIMASARTKEYAELIVLALGKLPELVQEMHAVAKAQREELDARMRAAGALVSEVAKGTKETLN